MGNVLNGVLTTRILGLFVCTFGTWRMSQIFNQASHVVYPCPINYMLRDPNTNLDLLTISIIDATVAMHRTLIRKMLGHVLYADVASLVLEFCDTFDIKELFDKNFINKHSPYKRFRPLYVHYPKCDPHQGHPGIHSCSNTCVRLALEPIDKMSIMMMAYSNHL